MLHKLKIKIQRAFVLARMKSRHRRHPGTGQVMVGSAGTQLWRHVLLLVPEQRELVHHLAVFLEKLRRMNPALVIDALVPERVAGMYRTDRLYNDILTLQADSFTWLGFPATALVRQILDKRYDLIIDLYQPPDIQVAYLAAKSEGSFRIGLKSDHSAYFYNVELVPQGGNYLDLVYKTAMIL
jgi:hypothetical protein